MDNPHADHRSRMRQRLLTHGAGTMHEHEILEILLYFSVPRADTNVIAHRLIDTFGSIPAVLEAPPELLKKVQGVGDATIALLKIIAPICKYYLEEMDGKSRKELMPEHYGPYMVSKFIGENDEMLYAVALDANRRILTSRMLGKGNVNSASINARSVMEFALEANAVAIVLAHNHPGGAALPSKADLRSTEHLKSALALVGVTLDDHIIVAGSDYYSLYHNA